MIKTTCSQMSHYFQSPVFGLLLLMTTILSGCSSLQAEQNRQLSTAYTAAGNSSLSQLFTSEKQLHPNSSGFMVLDTGRDAFLKRLAVIEQAEKAIDLQYYIWNSDHSGRILAEQLLIAADKGIKIRLLLDDFNIGDRDEMLSLVEAHSNIEIRIYNPNASRTGFAKVLGLIGDFGRMNQRMHNKSIVVDGSVAIVGGRNIGDEYFDLHHEMNFRDRDILAVGEIVSEVSNSFDAYWNNERAFSIAKLNDTRPDFIELNGFREQLKQKVLDDEDIVKQAYNIDSLFESQIKTWPEKLVWAKAELIFDRPLALDDTEDELVKRVASKLAELAQEVEDELLIESAYLIPGDEGIALLGKLTAKGVQVSAVTNSLASNDLTTNHSGYARRREDMLANLIELYELRPDAELCQNLVDSIEKCDEETLFGLHAKSMVFDREIVFVGSFNVNQRSVYLNTETALIIYSSELAGSIAEDIEESFSAENSWKVELDKEGELEWVESSGGKEFRHSHEPQTGFWRRFSSGFYSIFPIEKYL